RSRRKTVEVQLRCGLFDALTDEIELSFEIIDCLEVGITPDEDLLEHRFDDFRRLADWRVVRRDVTPTEQRLTSARNCRFDDLFAPALTVRIARQTDHRDAVVSSRRQFESQFLALGFQELVRNLK